MAGDGETRDFRARDDGETTTDALRSPGASGFMPRFSDDLGETTKQAPLSRPAERSERAALRAASRSETTDGALADQGDSSGDEPSDEPGDTESADHSDDPTADGDGSRRRRRRTAANSQATRLSLALAEESWLADLAAFTARGCELPALPLRPSDFAEAYALTAAERSALPKRRIKQLNSQAGTCVTRALRAATFLDAWRQHIAHVPVDLARIDRIDTYARALSHADARLAMSDDVTLQDSTTPGEPMVLTRRQHLERLLDGALAARRRLHSEVKGFIAHGRLASSALHSLKGGRGHYKTAQDVLSLLELRRSALATGATSNISPDEAQRYTVLATTLIEASARTTSRGQGNARSQLLDDRARAFTLLWLAYRQAQRAIRFICGDYVDVRAVLPPLVGKRG